MSNIENTQVESQATDAADSKKKPLFKKVATFQTPDGLIFNSQKEAAEHVRKHLVVEAVDAFAKAFTGTKTVVDETTGETTTVEQTLGQYLLENKDAYLKALDAAKIERPAPSAETLEKMRKAREAQLEIIRAAKAKKAEEEAAAQA